MKAAPLVRVESQLACPHPIPYHTVTTVEQAGNLPQAQKQQGHKPLLPFVPFSPPPLSSSLFPLYNSSLPFVSHVVCLRSDKDVIWVVGRKQKTQNGKNANGVGKGEKGMEGAYGGEQREQDSFFPLAPGANVSCYRCDPAQHLL